VNLATGMAYVDGWTDGRGCRQQARMDDVCRPAAGAGEGRGGGTARGLWQAAKPQSRYARLWLVSQNIIYSSVKFSTRNSRLQVHFRV